MDLYWAFSDSVTGTNDWTLVSVEFDAIDFVITVFLEMSGTGKCWFDNVKLEDIGSAKRRDINCTPFEKYTRFEQYWKGYDPMKD